MKLFKFCVAALLASTEAIHIKNLSTDDVPRSSQEQTSQEESEQPAKVVSPVNPEEKQDKETQDILHEAEEDEDITRPDELNKNFKIDIKSARSDISFSRSYDHLGYNGGQAKQDAARIDLQIKEHSKSPKTCQQDEWAIIHYKMWSLEDGQLLEDTNSTHPDEPLTYLVGHYQVSKCIDIAVQQMHVFETAMIHCPNDLDIGGGIQNQWHNKYGNVWVDNKIDTRYKITLLDCDQNPVAFDQDKMNQLKENEPFYLLSENVDKNGVKMALTINAVDLYAPRDTGVHNVELLAWSGFEMDNKLQQWLWNEEDGYIQSVGKPGSAMFEGFNLNIIAYKIKGLPNQRFKYNMGTQRIENRMSGRAIDTDKQIIESGQNVVTREPDATQSQKWDIKYQNDDTAAERKRVKQGIADDHSHESEEEEEK